MKRAPSVVDVNVAVGVLERVRVEVGAGIWGTEPICIGPCPRHKQHTRGGGKINVVQTRWYYTNIINVTVRDEKKFLLALVG